MLALTGRSNVSSAALVTICHFVFLWIALVAAPPLVAFYHV
ncbi:MAG: hypothetical protein SGI99_00455 [Pseudomonadota bacterium]|nr:hypothetical protein [Pseudomonadota bacterium]